MSHWHYVLRITYPYYPSLSGACTWECYMLRITYPYYASAITQRRLHLGALWTTHHVSALCIKRRKPAGEGYELRITYPYYASLSGACTWECYRLRITYPYYVSRAESPPERAMYYALRIRIMYQEPKARRRGLCTTHYVSALCIKHRKPAGESYVLRITYPYYYLRSERD